MSIHNDKINELKLELQSATRRNLRKAKVQNSLRALERSLRGDICIIHSECDFILQQMEELKNLICHVKYEILITEIDNFSEKSQIENELININTYKQEFEDMFAKGRKISELHHQEVKEKEAELEEIERQKIAKVLEANELRGKEAAAIESECDIIERDCSVLKKKNKALMLKLSRRLLEAENTRREIMKKNGFVN